MRRGRGVLLVVVCFAFPAWGAGQDLVVNGGFDGDIDGWKIVRGEGVEVWDPLDSQNNPASGSLHLTNTGAGPNAVTMSGQCIELTPSGTYEFGTNVRFPAGSVPGVASVVVGWFGNPCCSGTPLAAGNSPPVFTTTSEVWVETFTRALSAPPGTVAVGVGPGLLKLESGSPEAAAAAFTVADGSWPRNPACPESGARADLTPGGAGRAPAALGAGASLEALFDRVRFGLTGTTPVRLESFSVE